VHQGGEFQTAQAAVLDACSTLGFGAAPIGNLYAPISDAQARDAIAAALKAGVTYFDTAPLYGFGLSESRLGAALAEFDPDGQAIVSTKVGRRLEPMNGNTAAVRHGFAQAAPYEPVFDYSYDGVMRAFEESQVRLQRERIDMLLVHDLGALTHGDGHSARWREFRDGGYRALRALRDGGAVAAIGLGVNEWEIAEAALGELDFDVVLLAGRYTLLEQSALTSFLPLCAARGVSVIIGGPYNSGILAQSPDARPAHYNYEAAPPAVIERVRRLAEICQAFDTPLAAAALQFPLAHPQVHCVIPGLASAEEVAAAGVHLRRNIPAGLWDALREQGLLAPGAPTPATPADGRASPMILLDPKDNVLVCRRPITAGDPLIIDSMMLNAPDTIEMGHKVARRPLAVGEKVFKYGAPIGSMFKAVARGGHVHLHNMRSDYIASHTRDAVGSGDGR
jgi:D-threo-aldose 1-dehydrogenase